MVEFMVKMLYNIVEAWNIRSCFNYILFQEELTMTEINNEDLEKVSGGQSQYKNKYRSATFECTDSNCKGVV